ncbi:hypothetical protein FOA52_002456 [Chlamydomonas sp. UWO 241]|nr:hypothetical protein FOA52_002456 [Chlamydomonas sp. UWO 241]
MAPVAAEEPAGAESCSVCVALHVRPLVASEREQGCRECIAVDPGTTQVSTPHHRFTYDAVFGGAGAPPDQLYSTCVAPLVTGLFRGYNATVFAYGQTGSGKSFTMGSEYRPGGRTHGVIPEAIAAIFRRINSVKDDYETAVRVSFVEIHKEDIRDLLVAGTPGGGSVSIRETSSGVSLYGATEKEVRSVDEMAAVLEMGTLCRSTASTNMNSKSSRSHAIYTITVEQRRTAVSPLPGADDDDEGEDNGEMAVVDNGDDYLCAKMHLVDLAGSERAKRTKAEGARLKEGIHINRGLLALGNVINSIVDKQKHIPYRDSKLTRLLQDSLGGNSRTLMIACISPADVNLEEGLNTLRYADRARHIRNTPTVNRDPVAAQVAALRQTVARLQAENAALRRDGGGDGGDGDGGGGNSDSAQWALVEQLQGQSNAMELENARLKVQLECVTSEMAATSEQLHGTRAELELLRATMLDGGGDRVGVGGSSAAMPGGRAGGDGGRELLKGYLGRIADLEKEVRSLRSLSSQLGTFRWRTSNTHDAHAGAGAVNGNSTAAGASTPGSAGRGGMVCDIDGDHGVGCTPLAPHRESPSEGEGGGGDVNGDDEAVFQAEMAAHALEQEKMHQDMAVLQRLLEAKERKVSELQRNSCQVPALKQHYDRVLQDLETERDALHSEKMQMVQKLNQLQAASEEERKRLEAAYRERIAGYDERLKDVRRKERDLISMQKLKQRTEELCGRLDHDISRIKQQKVALQKDMDARAKQFQAWRVERERELLQLKRQNRRAVVQIQHLEALQAKQNAVLQRKICDANAARRKLKELQGGGNAAAGRVARGAAAAASSGAAAAANAAAANAAAAEQESVSPHVAPLPLLRSDRDRREWVEKELDMCNQSYEYQRVLDGELAQRAEASRQLREVEKRLMLADNLVPASPLVVDGRVFGGGGGSGASSQGGGGSSSQGGVFVDSAEKARMMARKEKLSAELAEHNAQICELQAAWEAAKLEEEERGGGAADAGRWVGVRNTEQHKDLLRTLFKVACDHKASAMDVQLDLTRLQEETDVMRVQLDAARKEADAQRKRTAAIEAAAASAIASPSPYSGGGRGGGSSMGGGGAGGGGRPGGLRGSSSRGGGGHGHDAVDDAEVDDLLHQLQVVAATPGSAALSRGMHTGDSNGGYDHDDDGDGTVHVVSGGSASTASEAARVAKELSFPTPPPASSKSAAATAFGGGSVFAAPISSAHQAASGRGRYDNSTASVDGTSGGGVSGGQGHRGGGMGSMGGVSRHHVSADALDEHCVVIGDDDDDECDMMDVEEDEPCAAEAAGAEAGAHQAHAHAPQPPLGRRQSQGQRRAVGPEAHDLSMGDDDDSYVVGGEEEEEEEEEEWGDEDDDSDDGSAEDADWDPTTATPARGGARVQQRAQLGRGASGGGRRSGSPDPADDAPAAASSGAAAAASAAPARPLPRSVRSSQQGSLSLPLEQRVLDHINAVLPVQARAERLTVKLLKDCLAGQLLGGKPWRAGSKNKETMVGDYAALHRLFGAASDGESATTSGSQPQQQRPQPQRSFLVTSYDSTAGDYGAPSPMAITPQPGGGSSPTRLRASLLQQHGSPGGPAASASPFSHAAAGRQGGLGATLGTPMFTPDSPHTGSALSSMGSGPPREHALTPLSMLYIQRAQEARERTAQLRHSIQKGSGSLDAGVAAAAAAERSVSRLSLASAQGGVGGLLAAATATPREQWSAGVVQQAHESGSSGREQQAALLGTSAADDVGGGGQSPRGLPQRPQPRVASPRIWR